MIYLDYSATTPVHEEVLKTYVQISRNYWGNPSSLHEFGAKANGLFEMAKKQSLSLLKANHHNIYFTSGATEASNLAIRGIAYQYNNRGKHLITTMVEHSSVYETFKALEREGFEVTYLTVNEYGLIDLEQLQHAVRKDTILVSIMMVNAEIGTILPIERIGKIIKAKNPHTFFHSDIVQAVGKVNIDLEGSSIDLASIAGHKIYGPKGVGALIVKDKVTLHPILFGGEQQDEVRPGTIDLASIVSMSKALRLAIEGVDGHYEHVKRLSDRLYQELSPLPYLTFNSDPDSSIPHVVNFSVRGVKSETVLHALAGEGIYISSKSACSSKSNKPSRVLQAIGCDDERASASLRVSLSHLTTEEEVEMFVKTFKKIMNEVLVK